MPKHFLKDHGVRERCPEIRMRSVVGPFVDGEEGFFRKHGRKTLLILSPGFRLKTDAVGGTRWPSR